VLCELLGWRGTIADGKVKRSRSRAGGGANGSKSANGSKAGSKA